MQRFWQHRDGILASYLLAIVLPLTAIFLAVQLALPAFIFEHLIVLRTLQDLRLLEEDGLLLNIQRADLRSIVEPTVRMLERLSDRHPLVLVMPESPLLVDCDVERIGRVIENLITNAIKYSPEGGAITISPSEQEGFAVTRVEDSGIGIPATDRARLFDVGYRGDHASAVAPGLGLGLYIAMAIVRRHAGTLEAAARDPKGSVFTLRLPLAGSRQSSIAAPAQPRRHGPPLQYASS